jgi:hypothetical protein
MASRLAELVSLLEKLEGKRPKSDADRCQWGWCLRNGGEYTRSIKKTQSKKSRFTLQDIEHMRSIFPAMSITERNAYANTLGVSIEYVRKLSMCNDESLKKTFKFYRKLLEEKENGMSIVSLQPPVASSVDGKHAASQLVPNARSARTKR